MKGRTRKLQEPSSATANLDAVSSNRLRKQLDHTMRMANKAQQKLQEAGDDNEEAVEGITQLIEEAKHKHDAVRNEIGMYGVTVPMSATVTDSLSTAITGTGRRLQMERQVGDIQEACRQLKEMMDSQQNLDYDVEERDDGSSPRDYADGSAASLSGIRARNKQADDSDVDVDDDDDDDDDDSEHVMTPRGVYVHRCLPLTKADLQEEGENYKAWTRLTHINILGLVIFLLYVLASGGYIYARCRYSLQGLGSVFGYGVFVLIVELLSILSLIFYGIWLCAKTDQGDVRAMDADSADMRRLYVIRVFILCKDETLATVRRTISSVKNAYPTEGCERKLYLLDESKDDAKRDFFMSAKSGADVIYIAPPVRPEGTRVTNWRSDIMNFTLSLIYPEPDDEGYKNISVSELVCVINADQTCSSSFFVSLLRYMDSGDDIAAAICPRICYNVDADCDIFDQQRVAYYEKTQLGMDAYGFTACMFTNMLLRSRALQEIGWFPNETLSENWELGMLLRSAGWKSRYVPEYSTIGQSPEEICECIDDHYRHSRGYFQTFWSGSNPFLCRGLGLFYRLMYASRCLLNFASALWIPVFTLIPIVQLIGGWWPVTFTIEVAVTMMAHYAVRTVMLHYAESLKQMRALWLSRIAVANFWWSDLKASLFVPAKRALGPNTSFRSRAWSTAAPIRNIKALFWPLAFMGALLAAFIGGCLYVRTVVNLPVVLSLCLCVINFVAPALLVLHWLFGPGRLLSRACTLFMALSWAAGIAAFVFLWLLWPREVDFERAAEMSLSFLDAQRSGPLPFGYPVEWRKNSGTANIETLYFTNDTMGIVDPRRVDLDGGFYNDGEIGPVKVTWNIAMTVSMLAWSLIEYKEFWERKEPVKEHAIALLAHGLSYVEQCYQITPITLVNGERQKSDFDVLIYVVGDTLRQRQNWYRPEDLIDEKQFIGTQLLEMSPSDLSGQVVAALMSGALALREHDKIDTEKTFKFANAAHRLFRAALYSPGLYVEGFNGTDSHGVEEAYPSTGFGDDLFWGASWLFHAGNRNIRSFNQSYYREALKITMDIAYKDLDSPGADVDYVNNIALVHAATQTKELHYHLPAQSFIYDWICDRDLVKMTRNGRAYYFDSPHLGSTATVAALAAVYVKVHADWDYVKDNKALVKSFQCFAVEQARYLLGGQVSGLRPHKPFMIGYNDDTFTRTWHRGASCPPPGQECSPSVPISDAPDYNTITGALLWNPIYDDFPEDARGRNTTVVSLENNMAVPLLYAAVSAQGVAYSECLAAQGSHFYPKAICRKKRPAQYPLGPKQFNGPPPPEFQGIYKPKETENDKIPPPPPPAPKALVPAFP